MAKRIPSHKVEEIYNAADVVEILGDYLQMKKRGSNYFALSPFANEKTPSFAISPSKNIWKDFSTGKGGNAVTFLMEAEGMSYVEALKYIAEKYNIALELEESPEDFVQADRRESLYILNEFGARYFHEYLMENEKGRQIALSYFKERGILETTIAAFQLGYAPDAWEQFSQEAGRNQFKEEYLEATGLAFRSEKTGRLIDRFRGRIMFPIHNHLGKVVGFGGRILKKQEKAATYINSPESEIYHKSNVLYGLHHGKKSIRDEDRCLLVEGYMDVVALYQAGIENVVASSGTALTSEQIRLIKRFTKNVLLIFDADRAGIAATLRGIDLLLEAEMAVRVLLLPEGEDPDSYVKANGKSGFNQFVKDKSQDFIDFKVGLLMMELDFSDPQQKTQAIHETAQTLARIPDQVKQAVYLDLSASKLGIPVDVMQRALSRALADRAKLDRRQAGFKERQSQLSLAENKEKASSDAGTITAPLESLDSVSSQEVELVRLLLNYAARDLKVEEGKMTVVDYLRPQIEEVPFESPILEKFKQQIFKEYSASSQVNLNHFINHKDQDIARTASQLLTIPYEVSKNWEKYDIPASTVDEDLEASVLSALHHFNFHHIRRMLKEVQGRIKVAKNNAEIDKLLKQYQYLKKMEADVGEELGGIIIHE
ncbi:MAG TPA: DNA primase [Bacteroidetes bacterium]|nr:DNA primase [Bacteroidota bacterium]